MSAVPSDDNLVLGKALRLERMKQQRDDFSIPDYQLQINQLMAKQLV